MRLATAGSTFNRVPAPADIAGRNSREKRGTVVKATDTKPNVTIAASFQKLTQEALELFVSDARKAIGARERFCVAVSRHTPMRFFELLGERSRSTGLLWDKIHLFWVDGCCGPPDFRDNNCSLATRRLISKTGIPAKNVHHIRSENSNCRYVASTYERTIHNVVGMRKNGVPRFDLIILGMSADGHVGSLFSDTYAFFDDTEDLVRVVYFMDERYTRITLTNPVLRAASHIAVLVYGEKRAGILREVLTSEPDEVRYPVHAIWPVLDRVTWLVDRNAARLLLPPYRSNKTVRRTTASGSDSEDEKWLCL